MKDIWCINRLCIVYVFEKESQVKRFRGIFASPNDKKLQDSSLVTLYFDTLNIRIASTSSMKDIWWCKNR